MNHPFFYLSVAALGLFYGVFILSLARDLFHQRNTGSSDPNSRKPDAANERQVPNVKPVCLAHWIAAGVHGVQRTANSIPFPLKPFQASSLNPALSVN